VPVVGPLGNVDRIVLVVSLGEGDVPVGPAGADEALVAEGDAFIPCGLRAVDRPDVEFPMDSGVTASYFYGELADGSNKKAAHQS
jgi:hypothetical protein